MATNQEVTTISTICRNYRRIYTLVEFKRSGAYGGTFPINYSILLQAASLAASKRKLNSVPLKYVMQEAAGYVKSAEKSILNLERLTAEPFPLLAGGKRVSEVATSPLAEEDIPLYSLQDGHFVSPRYGNIAFTELGKIALKHQIGQSLDEFTIHKSMVPVALLRTTRPWAQGHYTIMPPCCPAELFLLEHYQIENYLQTGSNALTDEQLSEAWRGIDVGYGYTIYCTPDASMSLYGAAQGSFTIVPDITVDRKKKAIHIAAPKYTRTAEKTGISILQALVDDKFKTIKLIPKKTRDSEAGTRISILDVSLVGSDEEIVQELSSSPLLRSIVPARNVMLFRHDVSNDKTQSKNYCANEGSEDYNIESVSIKDMLWTHINYEFDERKREYEERIEQLERLVKEASILERISREKVWPSFADALKQKSKTGYSMAAEYIENLYMVKKKRSRKEIQEGIANGTISPDDPLPEGLTKSEIAEVFSATSTRSDKKSYLVLASDRKKYSYLMDVENELQELEYLEELVNDESRMLKLISKDALKYSKVPEFQRKSEVYFVIEGQAMKTIKIPLKASSSWDKENLPMSIYYNSAYITRTYGRNMNITVDLSDPKNFNKRPVEVLNCTTKDYIYIFQDKAYLYKALDVDTNVEQVFNKGIVPFSSEKDILVFTIQIFRDFGKTYYGNAKYFIIPKGGFTKDLTLEDDEYISSWCYIDDFNKDIYTLSCQDAQTKMGKLLKQAYVKLNPGTLPNPGYETKAKLDKVYGMVIDVEISPKKDNYLNILTLSSDRGRLESTVCKDYGYVPQGYYASTFSAFSDHMEIYLDGVFIPFWSQFDVCCKTELVHTKIASVPEYIWLHNRDRTSRNLWDNLKDTFMNEPEKILLMKAVATDAYTNYKVSQLEDWSILDPRFYLKLPKFEHEEYLTACDALFKKIQSCDMKLMPKHINPMRTLYNELVSQYSKAMTISFDDKEIDSIENTEVSTIQSFDKVFGEFTENMDTDDSDDNIAGDEEI